MVTRIYIEDEQIDLFKNENITIISSVLDIQDISVNSTDYTKTFTVPATKKNNRLFTHWWNPNINGQFDARVKHPGRIELDGHPFKFGKFTLLECVMKNRRITHYQLTFTGNLYDIATKVKNDNLSELDLSAYDHPYDSATVRLGLADQLFFGALRYTLFVKKNYFYDSDPLNDVQTPSIANIAFGGGPSTGVIWNDLRPSIQAMLILEAIETKYNITFSRDFFDTIPFSQLWLWLNPSKDTEPGGETNIIDWDGGDSTYMDLVTNKGLYEVVNTPASGDGRKWEFGCQVEPAPGFEGVEYQIISYKDGNEEANTTHTGDGTQYVDILPFGNDPGTTHEMYWEVKTTQEFEYTATLVQRQCSLSNCVFPWVEEITTSSGNVNDSTFVISEEMPKIKVIEWLKGIFNAFKLVVIPQEDGSFYVDTLVNYYATGKSYNVTRYINFEKVDIARGKMLNEISFKFKEPQTIAAIQFLKNTGVAYGDLEYRVTDDGTQTGELLDGDSFEIELPFEQMIYDRLTDQNDDVQTNIMYASVLDEGLDPASPEPHMHYIHNLHSGSKTIAFIHDDNSRIEILGPINIMNHQSTQVDPEAGFIFGAEFNEWDGVQINKTLFANYHRDYISAIFNIDKREYKYSAFLPLSLITKLSLNDLLEIEGIYYRIDKYSYNRQTSEVRFNLVTAPSDVAVNPFRLENGNHITDYKDKTDTISLSNSDGAGITKIDQGFGTSWVNVANSLVTTNNIDLIFDENNTGENREMMVEFTQAGTGRKQYLYILQNRKTVTFDSTSVTWDSDKVTFDSTS